ncbi:MAG TPA: hypothetical protein VK514_04530 [Candidatus Acidoferrum sp.]|nr:hypothetical protein [Candidatus Acidoferrum sp.]
MSDRGSQLILWIVIVISVTACERLRRIMPANMFGGAALVESGERGGTGRGAGDSMDSVVYVGKIIQRKRSDSRVAEVGAQRMCTGWCGIFVIWVC